MIRIGTALEALLWAFLGGWVARILHRARGSTRSGAIESGGKTLKSPPELAERRQHF